MSESLGIDRQVQNLMTILGSERTSELLKHYNGKFDVNDMFSHLWRLEEAHSSLSPEIPVSKKSKSESESLRKEGNKAYEKKKLSEALRLYNLSILAAPHPVSEDTDKLQANNGNLIAEVSDETDPEALPLAYANRSAVLFELKQYDDCLRDIERALQYGYPEKLQHKLTKRREGCSLALESPNNHTNKLVTHHVVKPPLVNDPNPALPAMSSAVKVAFGPSVGRYLVAQREILPGEVLVVEDIYSRCLYKKHLQTHCDRCFTRCLVPLPCPSCKEVVFCSQECRKKGLASQHRLECKVLPCLGAMNTCLIIPYRIITKIPFVELKNQLAKFYSERESGPSMELGFNQKGIYDHKDYRTIYCLVTNKEKRDDRSLLTICCGAFILTKLLLHSRLYFIDEQQKTFEPSDEEVIKVGGALFHHIMSDLSNGHRYGELEATTVDGNPDVQNIGAWVSPTLSLANHSCDQSVITCNKGNLGVMTAIQLIKPDQEVTTGYLKGYTTQGLSLRKEILTNHYLFECVCQACRENWPTFASLPDNYQMKCLECSQFINKSDSKCSSCGLDYSTDTTTTFSLQRVDQEVGLAILNFLRMRRDFNTTAVEVKQDDLRKTIKVIEIMGKYVMLPNKIYANAKAFLAGLLRNQRDYVTIKGGF